MLPALRVRAGPAGTTAAGSSWGQHARGARHAASRRSCGWGGRGGRSSRGVTLRTAAQQDPYLVLQVPRGSSRAEVRAAYLARIKLLHPDVSGDDTTDDAAALNAAYRQILDGFAAGRGPEVEEEEDVFDRPEAEPDLLFIDPFSCYNISPLEWQALQAVACQAATQGSDPLEALAAAGAQCSEGAVHYLSPRQLAVVTAELERMCAALDPLAVEAAAYFVADCLLRAGLANNRVNASSAGRW